MNETGVKTPAVAAWLVGIAFAFSTSLENGLLVSLGYVSQWALKAPAKVRDWLAPLLVTVACIGSFAALHHAAGFYAKYSWWQDAIKWSLAALGIASAAGRTGGAAKTNSM